MSRILINPQRIIGTVSPRIFGSFIENLERCIYGGVYDPGSPHADAAGLRSDVIAHAKAMGVSIVRFPGGCFAPFYHWQDGVGDAARRPLTRYDTHGLGTVKEQWPSSNAFGTDEYIRWCRMLGAEPFICVNMGSGSAGEARDWVEYCNQPAGSRWADLRVAHGHPQPHGVTWWALGNEISGDWEFGYAPDPADYVRRAQHFARGMKRADPAVKFALAGTHFPLDHKHRDWNRVVLDELFPFADAITFHYYAGLMGRSSVTGDGSLHWRDLGPLAVHRHLTRTTADVETAIQVLRQDIRLTQYRKKSFGRNRRPIGVAVTEYGPWYRTWKLPLDEVFNLGDALTMAAHLAIFVRNADIVTMANHAQLVHVLGALLVDRDRLVRQTIGWVLELMSSFASTTAVDAWHDVAPWCEEAGEMVAALDVAAATAADGTVLVMLTNRDPDRALGLDLTLTGGRVVSWSGRLLGGDLPLHAVNSFDQPDRVVPRAVSGHGAQVDVPPASLAVLRLVVAADPR